MRFLIIIIFVTLFTACKKEETPYTFLGNVIDEEGKPVANANVELLGYYDPSNAISSDGLNILVKTKTNGAGKFTAAFNQAGSVKFYKVNVFADGYFPLYSESVSINTFQNNTFTYNSNIHKLATIKISFKNTSPVSHSDEFHVYQENELFGPGYNTFIERKFTGGTFNELEHKYFGNSIDGYEISKTKGGTYTLVNWYSKKNGIIVNNRDSIFIASDTQGLYTINY